jgi:hypothetical protein
MNIESDNEGGGMADTGDAGTVFGSIMTEASADRGGDEDECEDVGEGDSERTAIVASSIVSCGLP